MTVFDFLTSVGTILGIGAALDICLRKHIKSHLVQKIDQIIMYEKTSSAWGADLIDGWLGENVFSKKSIKYYAIISFLSIAISYAFAYFTTNSLQDEIYIFSYHPSVLDIIIFLI